MFIAVFVRLLHFADKLLIQVFVDRKNERIQAMQLNADEVVCDQSLEAELVSGLAIHFRCLAQALGAYRKHCPKNDHFVQQLQLSDTGVSGGVSETQYRSNVIFGLQLVRGRGYNLAQDRQSQLFPFFRYWCPND